MSDSDAKPYPPSERKRREARKRGTVLKSAACTQAICLLAALGMVIHGAHYCWLRLARLLELSVINGQPEVLEALLPWAQICAGAMLVPLVVVVVVAVSVEWSFVGWHVEPAIAAPNMEHFDLASGLKRIGRSLAGAWLSAIKLLLPAGAGIWVLADTIPAMASADVLAEDALWQLCGRVVTTCGAAVLACAAIDFLRQRAQYYRDLGMTREDVLRELREDEGDPFVKMTLQSLRESMLFGEMHQRIRVAKVVIVERERSADGGGDAA